MDPNSNLKEQLHLAQHIINTDDPTVRVGAAIRLAELVEALDEWLRRGGFRPAAWEQGPKKNV